MTAQALAIILSTMTTSTNLLEQKVAEYKQEQTLAPPVVNLPYYDEEADYEVVKVDKKVFLIRWDRSGQSATWMEIKEPKIRKWFRYYYWTLVGVAVVIWVIVAYVFFSKII